MYQCMCVLHESIYYVSSDCWTHNVVMTFTCTCTKMYMYCISLITHKGVNLLTEFVDVTLILGWWLLEDSVYKTVTVSHAHTQWA